MRRAVDTRIRVLMLATDAHGGFGGIAQYNRDVIQALCGFPGTKEIVVLPRLTPKQTFEAPAKAIYDLSSAGGTKAYLTTTAKHALRRFDLVYCAHINLWPIAFAVARVRKSPLVLAIYGIDAWERPSGLAGRMPFSEASLVVSISQITLDRFRAWSGVAAEQCVVLPNAIHSNDFAIGAKDNPIARRLGVERRPVILTFGRMSADERYKGFDEVIESLPLLTCIIPNLVFVAAGDGSDRARLEAKAMSLGVAEHVKFPGAIEESEKADLFRLADAYVMPSSGEGFGFVVLEALACGIPVVASTADGTREAVRNGDLGLIVHPKDKTGLERAILKALATSRAVPPGLEYFSFSKFEHRLAAAFSKILPGLA